MFKKYKIFFLLIVVSFFFLQNNQASSYEELIGLVKLTKSKELETFLKQNKLKIKNIKNEIITEDGLHIIEIDINNKIFKVSNDTSVKSYEMYTVDANNLSYRAQNTIIFKPYLNSQQEALGEVFGINLKRKILYILEPNRSKKKEIKILEFISNEKKAELKKNFNNMIKKFFEKTDILENDFIYQIENIKRNTPNIMDKNILSLDQLSRAFANDLSKVNNSIYSYKFNNTLFFDEEFLKINKEFQKEFNSLKKYLENNSLEIIKNRNNFYLENRNLIDEKLIEIDVFLKKNEKTVSELKEKLIKLEELNIENSINLITSNYKNKISITKENLIYNLDLNEIKNLDLNKLDEFKELIKLNEHIDKDKVNKQYDKFIFYKNIKTKINKFFDNNVVLSSFLLIFLVIVLPIFIWIYIIKKSLTISYTSNYNLIFSYSFLAMTLGSLLLLIDLGVNPNLINFTKILAIFLLIGWLYLNIKNTKDKFIIFSLGQVFSFITLIFLFFLLASIIDKISQYFEKKK
jgi:hypothetical protein